MMKDQIDRYRPIRFRAGIADQLAQIDGAQRAGFQPLFILPSNALNQWFGVKVALSDRLISVQVPRLDDEWDCLSISAQSQAQEEDILLGDRGAYVSISHQLPDDSRVKAPTVLPPVQMDVDEWRQHVLVQNSIGLGVSKVGGLPCWLQEPLHFADFEFVLQLDEFELVQHDPVYAEVFQGGLGYLFLESLAHVTSRGDGVQRGIFVVQYS